VKRAYTPLFRFPRYFQPQKKEACRDSFAVIPLWPFFPAAKKRGTVKLPVPFPPFLPLFPAVEKEAR